MLWQILECFHQTNGCKRMQKELLNSTYSFCYAPAFVECRWWLHRRSRLQVPCYRCNAFKCKEPGLVKTLRFGVWFFSNTPPLLPFKIRSCFQRKFSVSDFVRWCSYISNDFLNCFQCNVWVSTMCFAMAVKPFFMFNSSCERINNHWLGCWEMFIVFEYFMHVFFIRKIIKQENHITCIYSAFAFLGCKNVGLKDLRFTKPACIYSKKIIILMPKVHKTCKNSKKSNVVLIVKSHQTCIYSKNQHWHRWIGFGLFVFLSICRSSDFSLSKLLIFWSICRFCALLASKCWLFFWSICVYPGFVHSSQNHAFCSFSCRFWRGISHKTCRGYAILKWTKLELNRILALMFCLLYLIEE